MAGEKVPVMPEEKGAAPERSWPDLADWLSRWEWPDWFGRWEWPEGVFPRWMPGRFPELLDVRRGAREGMVMRVEEFEDEGDLVIRAELPGVDPERDIAVTVTDGHLSIRAERHEREEVSEKGRYRSEFRYGSYARSLPLPAGATEADVRASYRDGILEVRVARSAEEAPEEKKIPVSHD